MGIRHFFKVPANLWRRVAMKKGIGRKFFHALLATHMLVGGIWLVPKAQAQEQHLKGGGSSKTGGDNEIVYRDPDVGFVLTRKDIETPRGRRLLQQLKRIDAERVRIGGVTETDKKIAELNGDIAAAQLEGKALGERGKRLSDKRLHAPSVGHGGNDAGISGGPK